jgi:hypothetical protein
MHYGAAKNIFWHHATLFTCAAFIITAHVLCLFCLKGVNFSMARANRLSNIENRSIK